MKWLIPALLLVVVSFLVPTAHAQTYPAAEIFGGYSFVSFDAGGGDRLSMHGFNAAVTGNANRWFGVVGDLSWHRAGTCEGFAGVTCSHSSFAAGPQITVRGSQASGFVRGLFGVDHAGIGAGALGLTASITDNTFLAGLGGGVDVRATPLVSIRAIQIDYLTTNHFSNLGADRQHSVRISAGVVFTLARR